MFSRISYTSSLVNQFTSETLQKQNRPQRNSDIACLFRVLRASFGPSCRSLTMLGARCESFLLLVEAHFSFRVALCVLSLFLVLGCSINITLENMSCASFWRTFELQTENVVVMGGGGVPSVSRLARLYPSLCWRSCFLKVHTSLRDVAWPSVGCAGFPTLSGGALLHLHTHNPLEQDNLRAPELSKNKRQQTTNVCNEKTTTSRIWHMFLPKEKMMNRRRTHLVKP